MLTIEGEANTINITVKDDRRSEEGPLNKRCICEIDVKEKALQKRYKWEKDEKLNALNHFSVNIKIRKAPGKSECIKYLQDRHLTLDWKILKNMIKNSYYKR